MLKKIYTPMEKEEDISQYIKIHRNSKGSFLSILYY